ncbi:MAG: hypothetical protein JO249_15755 [Acidobacteria bacterium]|nr:hypothetical protein [Acidobacteriota bacterium]
MQIVLVPLVEAVDSVRIELHNRRKGDAVRMEIASDADHDIDHRAAENQLCNRTGIMGPRKGMPIMALRGA